MKAYPKDCVGEKETTYFRKCAGKLLHMMRWSIPEIYISVRYLPIHINGVAEYHTKEINHVMKYGVSTPTRGRKLKPDRKWDRNNCDLNLK